MKKYNKHNFFKHTYCEWKEISNSFIDGREPNYKSKAGSMYFFDENGVARYSNHWGRAANCRWKLISPEKKNSVYCLAYATWNSFFPNNENEELYTILYNSNTKDVTFQHKGCLNGENILLRTATDTAKRITKLKEIVESDAWYRHFDFIEIEEARAFFIDGLINTNKEFLILKRELLSQNKLN